MKRRGYVPPKFGAYPDLWPRYETSRHAHRIVVTAENREAVERYGKAIKALIDKMEASR